MADDLNVILGTKIDSSNKSVTEINKQITDLSTKIKSLKISINVDDTVIRSLNDKIDKLKKQFNMGVKFKIDDTDINKAQLKVQKIFGKSIKFNPEIDSQGISDFKQRVNDIRSDIDKLAKVEINTSKNGSIKSALITYKDEMGQLVQETMTWQNHLNKSGDLLKRVFTTTNIKYVDDLEKATKELDKQNKNLLAQESYFNRINKTVSSLKENISNTSITKGLDVNNFKTDIQNIDTLISNMKNMDINSDIYAKSKVSLDGMIKNIQHKLTLDKDQLNQLKKQEDIYARINKQLANLKDVTVKNDKYDSSQYNDLVNKYNDIVTAVKNGSMSFDEADTKFKKLSATTKEFEVNAKKASNTTNAFSATFKRFISYFSIYKTIELTRRAITEMASTVTKLDTAMYNIQMVTGGTRKETELLMLSYNKLGKELGATTLEVSTSANEFLRQGKTVQETNTLIENAMILSKIGMISSAESTQYLTSAMKGYNVEVSKSLDIVDKFSAVDMVSATSAGGIAEAMSRTASSARLAGIEIDRLVGYIALVGEVTQKDMASVGESFKTIFSRMGNVKLGQLVDEDGNDITSQISDVEKVLSKVDIKLRSSATEFRDFGVVLDEVGLNWKSFNDVEKNAIATTFAGMRQRENFLVLMDNYGTALKYAETSLNSAGTAMQKFEIYQESIEAKTNKLRTAFELLATKTLNSGLIKGIVDLSTEILTLINNMGGLVPVLTSVGLIWLGWKTNLLPSIITQFKAIVLAQGGMITSSISASMAQLGLAGSIKAVGLAIKSVLLTNPAGWALLAVGAIASLVGIVDKLNNVAVEAKEKVNNLSSELSDLQNKSNNINTLSTRFFELKGIDKTNEQLEEYYDIQNQLKELIPDLNGSINEQGNFIIDEEVSVTSLSNAYKELLDDKRKALAEASKESIGYSIKEYENEKKKIEDLIKANELYKKSKKEALTDDEQFQLDLTQNTYNVPIGEIDKAIKDTSNSIKKYSQEINSSIRNIVFETKEWGNQTQEEKDSILQAFSEIEPDILSTYGNMLENGTLEVEKLLSAIKDTDSYQKAFNRTMEDGTGILDTYGNSLIDLSNSIKSLSSTRSEIESLTDILNNLNDGNFSASDMEQLLSISEEFLPYLNDEIALREKLNETITDYKETYKKEYYNIISTSEEYYNARIKGDTELHNTLSSNIEEFFNGLGIAYKDDFDNYTDLENAKLKLTNNIVKQLAGEWFNYFDSFGNIINEKLDPRFGSGATASYASGLAESALKIKNARDNLFKIIDDSVYEPIEIKFDSDSIKSSADKAISEVDRLKQELEKRLQDNEFKLSLLEFSGGEDTLTKQIIIYQQMQDEVHKLAQKYRAMGLSENDDYIQQLRTQWMDYANSIAELESISFDNSNKGIDRTITQFELEQQLLKENSQEYIDIENKKYNEIVKREQLLQAEISRLQAIGNAQAKERAEELIDVYYDTVQQRYSIIANLQSSQISIFENQIEELEKQKSAMEDLHNYTMQMIEDELNAKKKSVQEEIDGIERTFNARKQALRDEQDARNYEKGLTEKSSVVANLENQLALIKNDETAIAKRKQLEQELADAKEDLADYQYEHSIDLAEKALDEELEIQKSALEEEIDELDDTLSNEVTMRELANKRIEKSGEKLKAQLIKHAKEYGTFTIEEVTNAWDVAGEAVDDFNLKQLDLLDTLKLVADKLKEVQADLKVVESQSVSDYASSIGASTSYKKSDAEKHAQMVANAKAWTSASNEKKLELESENQKLGKELGYTYDPQTGIWYKKNGMRAYHTGGVVGGTSYATKSTEELAKLLKGELVITPPQADKVMDMITNNSNSEISISIPIVIEGNADSDTVKALEKQMNKLADTVIDKLNTARNNTGFKKKPKFV